MIEEFRLRVFIEVAAQRSFTKAALRLNISQPAVSQNISELEKSYGVKFFERLRGEVVLTPAGELFLIYAEDIMAKYAEMSGLFQSFPETLVRISASNEVYEYVTGNLLKHFIDSHPELSFEQTLHEESADLKITLAPVVEKRGILALSYHPSALFSTKRLWKVLSYTLKPALK